jgi:DNA-directed RNA polymerase subunit RPC12/RpoP
MQCPACGSKETRVTCTQKNSDKTKRYRRCLDCDHRFISIEIYLKPPKLPSLYKRPPKRGEDCNLAVLTERNVLDIRKLALDTTYAVIAKRYGIHKDTVYRIVNRKRWRHLNDDS